MRYFRRFLSFVASRLFIVLLVLSMLIVTFYFAMNAVNIYIILKDGMAARAQVILMHEGEDALSSYFSPAEISRDAELQNALNGNSVYHSATIGGFDHRISLTSVWCWPWDNTARATFTESIPAIDSRGSGASSALPAWQKRTYHAILSREDDHWLLQDLTQVGINE